MVSCLSGGEIERVGVGVGYGLVGVSRGLSSEFVLAWFW